MAQPLIIPRVFLIDLYANQMRHDVGKPVIVIAFHPDHFDLPLGIRELADVAEEPPVFFGQAAKVEVGEDVSQQDQAAESVFPKNAGSRACLAAIRTKVHIGEDQRVVDRQIHA